MSILFCTPMYGGNCMAPYFTSMLELTRSMVSQDFYYGVNVITNESAVHRARNKCVQTFLATDFEYLMFIDGDIEFTPDDVGKLLNLNTDIAVGVYPMKKKGAPYAAWVEGKLVDSLDVYSEPVSVDYAGTGFMLIKRRVFEKIRERWPELTYKDDKGDNYQWFDWPIVDDVELSEDYSFCQKWRDLGGEVVMDPSIRLKHYGVYCFDGK